MRRHIIFSGILILIAAVIAGRAAQAQTPPEVGRLEYQNSDSLIQTFILVVNAQSLRYTLVGGSEDGIKSLRISSGELIANHKECYGATSCQVSGVATTADMPTDILTVSVISSKEKEQREKLKISASQGDKVYMITALPAFTGEQPLVITTNNGAAQATGTVEAGAPENAGGTEFTGDKGPVITLSIDKKSSKEFAFTVLSTDASGMDFIEIMKNGEFMDVELCAGARQCTMKKSVALTQPGEYTFIIKAMNKNGKISFQEELITSEE